jgi:hypothetical protein
MAGRLPGAYVEFLRTMGVSTGTWDLGDALFDLPTVMEAHRHTPVSEGGWHTRFLLVGVDPSATGEHYYIDRGPDDEREDGMLVRMQPWREQHRERLHAGFEDFLYFEAVRSLRMTRLPHLALFRRPTQPAQASRCVIARVLDHAERLGFQRVPQATRCLFYERGAAALLLHPRPVSPSFSLMLGSTDHAELQQLGRALQDATGIESA